MSGAHFYSVPIFKRFNNFKQNLKDMYIKFTNKSIKFFMESDLYLGDFYSIKAKYRL